MSALQSYLRANAATGRETERIGPFLATFSPRSANRFLNYAVPDDGAVPTASEVEALAEAYRRRNLLPRLEFMTDTAPEAEPALRAAGFALERRVPVMTCPPGQAVTQPEPAGTTLVVPGADAEYAAMLSAQHEAYDSLDPVTDDDVAGAKDNVARGGLAVVAFDRETGEAAGGGVADVITDGFTELAGFGVRARYRRRGIAAAITECLTRRAHERGAHLPFLTPAGPPEARIYARAGYRPASEMVHLSRENT
ncbi:GNAT family N-acetyltransferase [Amycolatopsis minnesotensis]|uniref:GNAT family N-acetyltransferase n=1 Tax=Amycolatopsis minnesotensis TaxID=337894 RepID=A0ABN2RXK2_9PSEU